ncbi:MAG: ribosome maturation factor RimP [bacterium]|nr:ribosome maturation factor RimP [bacterium]
MMDLMTLQDEVEKLVHPFLYEQGVELVDLFLSGNRRRILLRLYVDRPDGITIGECVTLSRELADLLDTHNPIQRSYVLEVSSPGLDRPLKSDRDFERSIGKLVKLEVNGQGARIGTLQAMEGDALDLEIDGQILRICRTDVNKANLHFEF